MVRGVKLRNQSLWSGGHDNAGGLIQSMSSGRSKLLEPMSMARVRPHGGKTRNPILRSPQSRLWCQMKLKSQATLRSPHFKG